MNLMEKVNEQFNFELSSAYTYMAMSNYCKMQGMDGFAHFMFEQAKEEFGHARDFYNFLCEMDVTPEYEAIEKPEASFETFTAMFKEALAHEKEVTRRIKEIYKDAVEVGCFDTQQFLEKYIAEQREEEDNFRGIVERMERINESWNGLYIFDAALGKR